MKITARTRATTTATTVVTMNRAGENRITFALSCVYKLETKTRFHLNWKQKVKHFLNKAFSMIQVELKVPKLEENCK